MRRYNDCQRLDSYAQQGCEERYGHPVEIDSLLVKEVRAQHVLVDLSQLLQQLDLFKAGDDVVGELAGSGYLLARGCGVAVETQRGDARVMPLELGCAGRARFELRQDKQKLKVLFEVFENLRQRERHAVLD